MDQPALARSRPFPTSLQIGVLLCVILAVGLECLRIPAVFTNNAVLLPDPDDWMRLWRAEQVAAGKSLILRNIEQVNPPAGMEMHWTAPVDYLIAMPGLIWRTISHRPNAFIEAAAWLPVALGPIYIAAMIVLLRRGHDPWTALLAGLFIAISPAFHRNFRLGHCDHHCALEFLYLLAIALWWPIRHSEPRPGSEPRPLGSGQRANATALPNSDLSSFNQLDPSRLRIILSGLCMGLAFWIAPQSMAVWLAILVGLLFAAWHDSPGGRDWWLTSAATWQGSITSVVWIGNLIERGYMADQLAIDKIGPFQAALQTAVLLVLLCAILRIRKPNQWLLNTPVPIVVVGLTAIAFIDGLYGIKFTDPMFTSEFARWSALVAELQPLYLHIAGQWSFAQMHEQLGILPYALPILAIFFVKDRVLPCGAKLTLLLLAFGFTIMSIFQRRWLDHVNLALAPVCVIGARVAAGALAGRTTGVASRTASTLLTALSMVILFFPTYAYSRFTLTAGPDPYLLRTLTTARAIIKNDADNPPPPNAPNSILSEDGEGPMLLQLTGHAIVAAPYHRDLDGLIAAAKFFAERDPAKAAGMLAEHQVRYIVVPFRAHEQLMNFERMAFGELRSFDPPEVSIDDRGRLHQKLRYKPDVTQTMVYRLAMFKGQGVPGVRLIAEMREGAPTPDGLSGLLYVVETSDAANPQSEIRNPQSLEFGVKSLDP